MSDGRDGEQDGSAPPPAFEKEKDLKHLLVAGAVNTLALIAGISLTVFYTLAARIYGSENFGLYAFALAAVEILMVVGGMATDKGITRFIAFHHVAHERQREASALGTGFWMTVICSGLMSALALLFSEGIAGFFGKPEASGALKALAPAILFGEFLTVMIWATIAAKVMRYKLYIKELGYPVLLMMIALPVGLVSASLHYLCYGHVIATLLAALWSLWAVNKVFRHLPMKQAVFGAPMHKEMFRYCIPMALTDPLAVIVQRASPLIIGRFVTGAQIGVFAACDMLSRAIGGVTMAFDPVICPVLAESVRMNDTARLRYNLQLTSRWVTIVCIPIIIFFVLFRNELLLLYGEAFVTGSRTLLIFICGRFFAAILGLSAWVLPMSGRAKTVLINQSTVSVVSVAACYYLTARYGIEGAALSWVFSTLLAYGLIVVEIYIFERAHPFSFGMLRVVLAGGITLAIMWTIAPLFPQIVALRLVLLTAIMLALYGVLFVMLARTPDDDELLRLLKLKKRPR